MIRHILLIAFKPDTQPAQIDAVRTAFLAIPHQVSGVTAVEWGENDSPEGRDGGFTHSVLRPLPTKRLASAICPILITMPSRPSSARCWSAS